MTHSLPLLQILKIGQSVLDSVEVFVPKTGEFTQEYIRTTIGDIPEFRANLLTREITHSRFLRAVI